MPSPTVPIVAKPEIPWLHIPRASAENVRANHIDLRDTSTSRDDATDLVDIADCFVVNESRGVAEAIFKQSIEAQKRARAKEVLMWDSFLGVLQCRAENTE